MKEQRNDDMNSIEPTHVSKLLVFLILYNIFTHKVSIYEQSR